MPIEESLWASTALIVAATCIFLLTLRYYSPGRRTPPGPVALPVIGNIWAFPFQKPWLAFSDLQATYGDVFHFHGLGQSIIVLNSKQAIDDLFEKRGNTYSDRPKYTVVGEMMGLDRGMPLMQYDDDKWRLQRKLARTALSSDAVKKYHSVQSHVAVLMCHSFLTDPAHFRDHVRLAAGRIVMAVTYGLPVSGAEHEYITHAESTMDMITQAAMPGAFIADIIPIFRHVPAWFPFLSCKKQAQQGRVMIEKLVETPYKHVAAGKALPSFTRDLLADSSNAEDDSEYKQAVMWSAGSLYSAGGETTYATILVFLICMTQHPEVQKKAQEELDRVIGAEMFKLPTVSDQGKLPYIEAIIKEVMRWHLALPLGVPRRVDKDDEYAGYHIPANSIVIPNVWPQGQEETATQFESLLASIKAAAPDDAPFYYALVLTKAEDRKKADLLAACGDLYKQHFLRTHKDSLCDDTIKAYELALNLVPTSDPEYLIFVQDVASWQLMRFNLRRDFADLDNAIEGFEKVVNGTPDTHRGMPIWLNNLSTALDTRFKRSGDMADLDRAIILQRKVLSLTDDGDAALPTRLNNLAGLLQSRYEKTGEAGNINEAESLMERCFKIIPPQHPNMRQCLNTRATTFRLRHVRNPNAADIVEAIKFYRQAVNLEPVRDRRILASSLEHLGHSYFHRFLLEGNEEDIKNAIATQQRGIDISPRNHPDMHRWPSRISSFLLLRFQRIGNRRDLDLSIRTQQEAIDVVAASDTKSAARHMQNLATLFFYRFDMTGSLADINQAILLQQKAAHLMFNTDRTYPSHLTNLGDYLAARFQRSQAYDDIEDALKLHREAVGLTHETDVAPLQCLASSLLRRSRYLGNYSDLYEAITCMRKAADISVTGKERGDRHAILGNLGALLIDSFNYEESKTDINEVIDILRTAIQTAPKDLIYVTKDILNLGTAYYFRYRENGDPKDIDEAMLLHQQAITLTDQDSADMCSLLWALGKDFRARYEKAGDAEDLEAAIAKFCQATLSPTGPPSVRLEIANWWIASSIIVDQKRAMDAFDAALQLQAQVAGLDETIATRLSRIFWYKSLPTTAAAVAMRAGQHEKALEWLEQGRCLIWNQVNSLRKPVDELRDYDEELAEDVVRVSRALEKAATRDLWHSPVITEDPEDISERISEQAKIISHLELAQEWDRVVDRVRDIPQFKDFLRPLQYRDLLKDLPKTGIVVMITVHEDGLKTFDGCDALALVPGSEAPKHIPLEAFSYNRAEVLRRNLQGRLRGLGLRLRGADSESDVDRGMRRAAEPGMNLSLQDILKELWVAIVRPIFGALEIPCCPSDPRRIWWCLTGPLASLPIHAAGIYKEEVEAGSAASDYVISSYTPTLSTLIDRVKNPRKVDRETEGLFVVSQPNTPDLPPIPGATEEARMIQQRVKDKVSRVLWLEGKEVTIERALEEMQSHSCVHLACHAIQEDDPSSSGFYLEDGCLELLEIIKKDIRIADFAFLSACQTSAGSDDFSEEAIHLATGMLAVGYRGVVATMWSIRDKYGSVVADYFYDHLLGCEKREDGKEMSSNAAACALHHAVLKLRRDLDNSENSLLTWVPYIHMGL